MAYRVVWSPRALDDIDSIASYIARDSAAYASAVVAKIIKAPEPCDDFHFQVALCRNSMTKIFGNALCTASASSTALSITP